MKAKKIILILLLIFSVFSMITIVYFAKNKMGLFGKLYDDYVLARSAQIKKTVKNNLDQISYEVKSLSEDNIVRAVFVSSSIGENTEKYIGDFDKIKNGIVGCEKVQTIDAEGKIIFSTDKDEINSQRIRPLIVEQLKEYFSQKQNVTNFFLDKNQFVSIFPVNTASQNGFVSVYYNSDRLLKGLNPKNLNIPFSAGNFIFFSSTVIDKNDINKIINYYSNPEIHKKESISPTIASITQFDGFNFIYYSKNEKYISPWTVFILLVDLFLLGTVIFTLLQIMKEDKIYKEVPLSTIERDLQDDHLRVGPDFEEDKIKGLVNDIEENKSFDEMSAKQGIEEMIMSNDIDLTELPEDKVFEREEEKFEFPKETLVEGENMETYDYIKPSKETEMLAEQDRILSGVDNEAFEIKTEDTIHENMRQETEDTDFTDMKTDEPAVSAPENEPAKISEDDSLVEFNEAIEIDSRDFPTFNFDAPEIEKNQEEPEESELEKLEIPSIDKQTIDMAEPELKPEEKTDFVLEIPEEAGDIITHENISMPEFNEEETAVEMPSVSEEIPEMKIPLADEEITANNEEIVAADIGQPMIEIPEAYAETEEKMETGMNELSGSFPENESIGIEEGEEILFNPSEEIIKENDVIDENPELNQNAPEMNEPETISEDLPVIEQVEPEKPVSLQHSLSEPPTKISSIISVEDYGKVAFDLAKNSLNINKIFVLKKSGENYISIMAKGFQISEFTMQKNDPILEMFLSKKKSVDIKGDIKGTRYLNERFPETELNNVEEMFIVPVIRQDDVEGIAFYARETGTTEPTNFQKSEIFNLGFLQDM